MEYYKSNQPAGSAAKTPTSNFERANRLLVSVGGADRRIPQCNHWAPPPFSGSIAVSLVEFPLHRKYLCWMVQKFSSGVKTHRLFWITAFEKHCVKTARFVPRPLFLLKRTTLQHVSNLARGILTDRKLSPFRKQLNLTFCRYHR